MGENLTTGSLFYAADNDNTWVKLGDVSSTTLDITCENVNTATTTSNIMLNTDPLSAVNTASATPDATPIYNNRIEMMKKGSEEMVLTFSAVLITNINVLVPNKVMEVTLAPKYSYIIAPGTITPGTYKMVVREPDEFDMEFGCALAIAKSIYGQHYTHEFVERAAREIILYDKFFLKEIRSAIKRYNQAQKQQMEALRAEQERQEIIERRRAKNKKRREKMLARKKENEINTIAEAIKRSRE